MELLQHKYAITWSTNVIADLYAQIISNLNKMQHKQSCPKKIITNQPHLKKQCVLFFITGWTSILRSKNSLVVIVSHKSRKKLDKCGRCFDQRKGRSMNKKHSRKEREWIGRRNYTKHGMENQIVNENVKENSKKIMILSKDISKTGNKCTPGQSRVRHFKTTKTKKIVRTKTDWCLILLLLSFRCRKCVYKKSHYSFKQWLNT